jgi:hypothetical protein
VHVDDQPVGEIVVGAQLVERQHERPERPPLEPLGAGEQRVERVAGRWSRSPSRIADTRAASRRALSRRSASVVGAGEPSAVTTGRFVYPS